MELKHRYKWKGKKQHVTCSAQYCLALGTTKGIVYISLGKGVMTVAQSPVVAPDSQGEYIYLGCITEPESILTGGS